MHWKRCPLDGHLFLLFLYRPHNPATPLPGSVRYPDGPVLQYPVLQNPVPRLLITPPELRTTADS